MFSLANLFTAANLISGIVAIILALSGRIDIAPFAIFCGLLFDFLDGFVARLFKSAGELGKQLDSLADMVTFGVAPGVIMLVVLCIQPVHFGEVNFTDYVRMDFESWVKGIDILSLKGNYVPFLGLIVSFFALFRLAKFNIDTRQSESFIGLPTPSMTLFFMTFPLVLTYGVGTELVGNSFIYTLFNPLFLGGLLLVFGVLMVSEVPLFSLKMKSFGWSGNQLRYIFLLISLVLILLFKVWSIALIVFLYLILSLIENIFFKKKRNEV